MNKKNSCKKTKLDERLTDAQLDELVDACYNDYARYVYKILRANEMEKYSRFKYDYSTAYNALNQMFKNTKHTKQIIEYHQKKERQNYINKDAENNAQVINSLEALRGYTTAPLMGQIASEDSFLLWNTIGSWNGALILAGLDPLTSDEQHAALRQHAIDRASLELLPDTLLRMLSPELRIAIRNMCIDAKRNGKYPTNAVVNRLKKYKEIKKNKNLFNAIMKRLGFPMPYEPHIKMKKIAQHEAQSYWRK